MNKTNESEISFIICTLEYKASLEEVLLSILKNKKNNDELILVINKEEKSNFPVPFLSHFDHVILNPVKGISLSRNMGVSISRHNYIAFLDDDTILPLEWRSKHRYLLDYESVAFVQFKSPSISFSVFHVNLAQNRYVMLDVSGSIIRKKAITEIGGFDESFQRSEDMDLGTRLYYAGWDLAFSNTGTSDVNSKNIWTKLRDTLVSSKFEARIIKKSQIQLSSSYLRQVVRIFFDHRNKLGLKRLKFIHTYFYLVTNKHMNTYDLLPRSSDCFIIVGSELYRLHQESRIVFTDHSLMICSLKKRNVFIEFEMNAVRMSQKSGNYYLEVSSGFSEKSHLFRKI